MSYKSKITVAEDLIELRKKLNSTKDHKVKLKLKSLIILKENPGKRQEDIANYLCIGYSTLKRWYRNYSTKDLDSFITIVPTGQKKSVIPEEVHEALKEKLHDSSYPLLGYWDAVSWVESNFGVTVKYQTLRKYMIKHFGTKLKVPRKSHYKKDEQAIEAFFKTA